MVKNGTISIKRKTIRAIYVSSYIPRKCGIATFTKDLTNAVNMLNPYALAEIMVLQRPEEMLNYPWEVKYKINQNDLNSYLQAAEYINRSGADVVMLEHEFGLCGGPGGEYIVPFVEQIKKPLVVTCHTIVDDPNGESGNVLKRIVSAADTIVVIMHQSADELVQKYMLPKEKIAVIPHGTLDLPFKAVSSFKKRYKNRIILGNINLMSPAKGIEYSIEATAEIAKVYPNVLCLIVGQTHPDTLRYEGEKYRNRLKLMVKKMGIVQNVKFVNRYVSLEELLEWLKLIDYYVTPYLDPSQISSGALAYAIGAGKLCISTPYLYANEVLSKGRGMLVPFKDPKAIAKAIIGLERNPNEKNQMEARAYKYGRLMTWSSVALQHLDLFEKVIRMKKKNEKKN
jgi:glycosyltransferase involved in cell wall biosynthesis